MPAPPGRPALAAHRAPRRRRSAGGRVRGRALGRQLPRPQPSAPAPARGREAPRASTPRRPRPPPGRHAGSLGPRLPGGRGPSGPSPCRRRRRGGARPRARPGGRRMTLRSRNPLVWIAAALIRAYQWSFSWRPSSCRFHPTCSQYTLDALLVHGAVRGAWLGVRRISRCHPWNEGGLDPVPAPRSPAREPAAPGDTPAGGPPRSGRSTPSIPSRRVSGGTQLRGSGLRT